MVLLRLLIILLGLETTEAHDGLAGTVDLRAGPLNIVMCRLLDLWVFICHDLILSFTAGILRMTRCVVVSIKRT